MGMCEWRLFSRSGLALAAAMACMSGEVCAADAQQLLGLELKGTNPTEPGAPLSAELVLSNTADGAREVVVNVSVQRDSALYSYALPDLKWGTDHAAGALSWTEVEGKKIEARALTDGDHSTSAKSIYEPGRFTEGAQFIDLGVERKIAHLRFTADDAHRYFKVDISASTDGQNYRPIDGLQGLNWHNKWGTNDVPLAAPVQARYLKLRYHNDGKTLDVIRTVATLSVYDGLEDETWAIPSVGKTLASFREEKRIPAGESLTIPLSRLEALTPGSYYVAARVESDGKAQLVQKHYFVRPPETVKPSPESRFGLNAGGSDFTDEHRRMGIGWIRFENMKWPFLSPAPGVYKYDGTVEPWKFNIDKVLKKNVDAGISIVPYLFMSPTYLGKGWTHPPSDLTKFDEFAFQTAARYGSVKHPPEVLKTDDKLSGLGYIHVYELWNEPNLDHPDWGHWKGPIADYYKMFRIGAAAIKRADPSALVCNGGYAGMGLDPVDQLRAFKYEDGKSPLDFVDVLSVHHYTGKTAPELATVNTNIDREGNANGRRSFEDDLRTLVNWRDEHKPGMPIWMTETGYDSAGLAGSSERIQAAWLPRDVMLMLAAGVDKVMVYRERGSKPELWGGAGVFREDNSYKPSWFTYATLVRQLHGATEGKRLPNPDPNVRVYRWQCGDRVVIVAWAVEGEGKLGVNLGSGTVTDSFGDGQQAEIGEDLPLSIFPVYITNFTGAATVDSLYAQAREQEQVANDLRQRQSRLRAYLFDFGNAEKSGSVEIGNERFCTPVVASHTWSEERGYGFYPKPGMQDETHGWVADKMDRDFTRMGPGISFRLRAEPGKYRLCFRAVPFNKAGEMTIRGAAGGMRTIQLPPRDIIEMDIDVGNEDLLFDVKQYTDLAWLTLVEK